RQWRLRSKREQRLRSKLDHSETQRNGEFVLIVVRLLCSVSLCDAVASVFSVPSNTMIPGEYLLRADPIELNAGRETRRIEVSNRGDRPVQVGSHFHFFEVNRCLG